VKQLKSGLFRFLPRQTSECYLFPKTRWCWRALLCC